MPTNTILMETLALEESLKNKDTILIQIDRPTRKRLNEIGFDNETFQDIVNRLLDEHEREWQKQQSS